MGICKHSTDDDNEWEGGPSYADSPETRERGARDGDEERIIRRNRRRRLRQRFSTIGVYDKSLSTHEFPKTYFRLKHRARMVVVDVLFCVLLG